jgi:hypothetical protein
LLIDLVDVKRTVRSERSTRVVEGVIGSQREQPPGRDHDGAGCYIGWLDDNYTRRATRSETLALEQIRAHQAPQAPSMLEQPAL